MSLIEKAIQPATCSPKSGERQKVSPAELKIWKLASNQTPNQFYAGKLERRRMENEKETNLGTRWDVAEAISESDALPNAYGRIQILKTGPAARMQSREGLRNISHLCATSGPLP
ncbi:MAG: hypothetical protein M1816_001017 [Peltula sp. TS41687]|nr:MAG: hypothetical protein M1816_001017 [Peltula sp. TS41687]